MKEYKITFEARNIVRISDDSELNDEHMMKILMEEAMTDWFGVKSSDVSNLKIEEVQKDA